MSEAVNHTTDQAFDDQVLGSPMPVLVDFWADWCVPCHMVSPIVEEIGREKGEALRVMKLNVDENPSTAQRFGVMGIPTLILFKDGEEKARVVGAKGKEAILAEIGPHIAA
ncbi:MAG TPA: thioredoxin [Actinomycetota bacterium]|jgi:thioredoxin 1|nr:thioredoxin [Actinomycetota bacterium]